MSNKVFCSKAIEVVTYATERGWCWANADRSHMIHPARLGDTCTIDPATGTFLVTKRKVNATFRLFKNRPLNVETKEKKEEKAIMEKPMKKTVTKVRSLFHDLVFGPAPQPVEKAADNRSREYPIEGQREGDERLRANGEYEAATEVYSQSVRQRLGDMTLMPTPPDPRRMNPAPLSDNWLPASPAYVGGKTRSGGDYVRDGKAPRPGDVSHPDPDKRSAADEGFSAETEDEQVFYGPSHPMSHLNMAPRPGGVGGMPVQPTRRVRKAKDRLVGTGLFTSAIMGDGCQQYRDEEDS